MKRWLWSKGKYVYAVRGRSRPPGVVVVETQHIRADNAESAKRKGRRIMAGKVIIGVKRVKYNPALYENY